MKPTKHAAATIEKFRKNEIIIPIMGIIQMRNIPDPHLFIDSAWDWRYSSFHSSRGESTLK
ncbi:MAG: hypothetical protein HXS48_06535 [Theionarchaea archaeon]|nr:hypothetical protein [Theionarchaea archaeon]